MRHDEPITFLRARLTSLGPRNAGKGQFGSYSFQPGTLCDPDRPDDKIGVVFKDCEAVDPELEGLILVFECCNKGTGVKAYDDNADPAKGGGIERVVWVTRSAIVYDEQVGPPGRRAPAREERRERRREERDEPRRAERPAREERGYREERRREPEPEPERPRREEPARRERVREPEPEPRQESRQQPAQEQPQQRTRPPAPTPRQMLFKMALTILECHRAAKYAAKLIVEEERKEDPNYAGMPRSEFLSIRTSFWIKASHDNLHTQFQWTDGTATDERKEPTGDKPPEDNVPM
jgi:hypothetical protein